MKKYTDDLELCASFNADQTMRGLRQFCQIAGRYDPNSATAKFDRDSLIELVRGQIDEYYVDLKNGKRVKYQWLQFLLDILEVGAATAIDIMKGERPKTVVAGLLSGFKAGRTDLNKHFQVLQYQTLINRMNADRDRILAQIYLNMNKSVNDYPWLRAKNELRAYLIAGTFNSAMDSLIETTGDDADDAADELLAAKRNAGITLAPTAAQYKASLDTANIIDEIGETWFSAGEQIENANEQIETAENEIAEAEAENPVNDAKKQQALEVKSKAEQEKQTAEGTQEKALTRVKAIYKLIKDDGELSPLLNKMVVKFPLIKTQIENTLARIENDTADVEDYIFIFQKFNRVVVDEMVTKPSVVERVMNILEATK